MKTIFKRAAAWFLTALMILNCVPVYAQDTSTDYSGQQISLADYVEPRAVDDNSKISRSGSTWTIPIYFYQSGSTTLDIRVTATLTNGNTMGLNAENTDIQNGLAQVNGQFDSAKLATSVSADELAYTSIQATRYFGTYYLYPNGSRTGRLTNTDAANYAVYVKYTPNNVTATFKSGYTGGEDRPQQQVKPGELITFPEAPDRQNKEHYEFGWIAEGETEAHKPGDKINLNENKEFTGKWTPIQYTAKFNLNYDGAPAIPDRIRTIEDEDPATFPTATREGYTLLGWNTAASAASEPAVAAYDLASDEGGVTAYADGAKYEVGEEIPLATATYDAVWAADSFMVTFDYNGGTDADENDTLTQEVSAGESVTLPALTRTPEDFWYISGWVDNAGNSYEAEAVVTPTGATTYTAQWASFDDFYVTFDFGEGSIDADPDEGAEINVFGAYGMELGDLPYPLEPDGKIFKGWRTASGTYVSYSTVIEEGSALIADVDGTPTLALTAEYVDATNEITYTVDLTQGGIESTDELNGEVFFGMPTLYADLLVSNIYVDGFESGCPVYLADGRETEKVFSHWEWKTADGEASDVVTDGGTLVAVFKNLSEFNYQVNFFLKDSDGDAIYTTTVPGGTNLVEWIAANSETKTSHMIAGNAVKIGAFEWTDEMDTPIAESEYEIVMGDTSVIGTLGNVTVTFYNNSTKNEQVGEVQSLPYGGTVSSFPTDELTVPDGMSFVEWRYTGTEGEVRFDSSTPVYENMQVYAHYAQMHTLTFYTDSEMTTVAGTVQVPHGEKFDTSLYPSVAVPEGQTLRYWVYDAGDSHQVFNPLLPVTSDMSLYPVFDNYVFVLKDAETGKTLTSIYNGNPVDFTVEAPEGYYYTGIKLADGTFIETDGEEDASTDLFKVTTAVNGQYTVNVTPVFEKQLTVVYHAGEGATILAAGGADTYTLTVDASVQMPGALDIVRTDSTTGVALDGWATTEDAEDSDLAASTTYTSEVVAALDTDGDGVVHLYPVWMQADGTVPVHFVSNYPDDATGVAETTYTVYIVSGTNPSMPSLQQAGIAVPTNKNTDGTNQYVLSGWSVRQAGDGQGDDKNAVRDGIYNPGTQYQLDGGVTSETTFYAIWIDTSVDSSSTAASFFIRADGTIPVEPNNYKDDSAYYPGSGNHQGLRVDGALKNTVSVVNDPANVAQNILAEPSKSAILAVIQSSNYTLYNALVALDNDNDDNTGWYVEWYAIKKGNDSCGWHVDGRIRYLGEYTVTYHANGGSNVPAAADYSSGTNVTIKYTNGNTVPVREGYTFVGWSKNAATTWQEVVNNTSTLDDIYREGVDSQFSMPNSNVDLYAIWKPDTLELSFNGVKYMVENNTEKTATQSFNFLVEKQNADGTYTTVKTLTNSPGNGSFSFDYEFDSSGLHTFRVTEIKGTNTNIAYDGAVYTITVYIGDGDQGLYEVGRTVMKNNVIQSDKTVKFVNRVGERDVTVTKVWNDNNDQDGIRPSYIVVGLTRDGQAYGSSETLTAANGWSATWTNLPIASDGAQYVYDVVETSAGVGYTSETTGDMDAGFTITNTHTPLTTEITVTKQWVDDSNAAKVRPEEIVLTLTGSDGSTRTATLTGTENSWTYTFTDLPVYYGGGNLVTYTLDETDVPNGYTKTVDGYTVTNTLQSGYSFTVNKNVAGNFASRTKEFSFTADILAADGKTVIRTETFTLAHGGSKVITGIPYGAYVQVTEDPDGYDAQHLLGQTPAEGASYTTTTPITNSDQGVTFLNTKTAQIDTGVDLDTIPYVVMLLSIFGAGALWLIGRRRRTQN